MLKQELQATEREAYEQLLNAVFNSASDEKAIEQALKGFIPGTDLHTYLNLITQQNLKGGKLTSVDMEKLDRYVAERKPGSAELSVRQALLNFDNLKDDEERIKQLPTLIKDTFDFTYSKKSKKPFHQEHQGVVQGEISKDSIDLMKKNATLDDTAFKKDILKELHTKLALTPQEVLQTVAKMLDPNNIDKENYEANFSQKPMQDYYSQSQDGLRNIQMYQIEHVDFKLFHPAAVLQYAEEKANEENNGIAGISNPMFLTQIEAGIRLIKIRQPSYLISTQLCQNLSLEQLLQIQAKHQDENVISAVFKKQFNEELSSEVIESMSLEERYDNLIKLAGEAEAKKLPKSLIRFFLAAAFCLGPQVNQYNKENLITLLRYNLQSLASQKQQDELEMKQLILSYHFVNWHSHFAGISLDGEEHTFNKHLDHFAYEKKGDLSEFKAILNFQLKPQNEQNGNYWDIYRIFQQISIVEDNYRMSLSTTGINDLQLNEKDNNTIVQKFKAISEQIRLRFLPGNKEKFTIDEPVFLHLQVQNIQTLHCKVFEFNTLTYYRKTMKPFDTSVDLDGLESTIVRKFDYQFPSNYVLNEKFDFPELAGRVGLFIIEFVGNGRSARAVVKKGSLSLIHKSTIAGHEAVILDDSRQICQGPTTGLWLENKFYPADKYGKIFINYTAGNQINTKVIMVHEDFAQLGEFTRKSESYDFSCEFYLNEESVLVGSTASILINPTLKIHGRSASLSLIQNLVVTVKTEDFIEQIPTTQSFKNLKFSEKSDVKVSFQVPPNLKTISVQISCQVPNTTTKKMQGLEARKDFNIETFQNSNQVHDYHLRLVNEDKYELLVLGKNGEPQVLFPLTVSIIHLVYGRFQQQLTTDDQGKVYLGQLKQVQFIAAQGRQWVIPNLKVDSWTYPNCIDLVTGGKVEIPVGELWTSNNQPSEELSRDQVTLIRSQNGMLVDDWFPMIKLVKKLSSNNHYFLLVVENLKPGDYFLQLRGLETQNITIKVHPGEYLNNFDNVILKKRSLQELVASQKIVKINESTINQNCLRFQLTDYTKNARVHIVATQFLPSNCYTLLKNLQTTINKQIAGSVFTFARWQNLLLSDRQLSDEYRYIFDREHAERTLGNSLDRPSLFNKRLFTRKTEIDSEVLNTGSTYEAKQEQYRPMMQQVMGGPSQLFRSQNVMPQAQQIQMRRSETLGGKQLNLKINDYITDYQNFLRDAPIVAFNLKPDENGFVDFRHDKLKVYSTVQIIVIDEGSAMQHVKNLQQTNEPQKRDLSLKSSLNETKGMTESRQNKCLTKGNRDFIADITSSQVMMVDDLQKVNQILQEISEQTLGQDKWENLQFVKRWSQMSMQHKNGYFGEYQCHELNFYIKRQDNVYFESVVRKFLSCKMEKSFLDLYLLDMDQELIKEFTQRPFKVSELNAFEKCLLIQVLSRNQQNDLATRIFKNMKEKVDAIADTFQTENLVRANRIFDVVLNMNSTLKSNIPTATATTTTSINRNMMQDHVMPESRMMRNMASPKQFAQMVQFDCAEMDYELEEDEVFNSNGDWDQNAQYLQQRNKNFNTEKFEQLENTAEYMETFYYDTQLKTGVEISYLIPLNAFWCDYAQFLLSGDESFISHNFTECISPRMKFLCQAILDLPSLTQASVHQMLPDETRGLTILAGSNMIIFKKEIKEVEVEIKQDFMVTHRYTRIDDYGNQHRSDEDEAIPEEFLINVPYECEVIMTNVSPDTTEFNLLYQVPIGSMPIKKTKFMKSLPQSLGPYSTQKQTFQFYFPKEGQFGHYPSNVSVGEKVTARGQFNKLNVVKRRKISDSNVSELNFDDLVQIGSDQQILDYIRTKNILAKEKGFDFKKVMFLLEKKDFWLKTMEILRNRQILVPEIWSLSLVHLDLPTIREYLKMANIGKLRNVENFFSSTLFNKSLDHMKMLEYNPMINSRAHKLGQISNNRILNKTFRKTYDAFLQAMACKAQLSFEDKIVYIYYLQLQDRIPEAITLFNRIELPEADDEIGDTDRATLEIQYDYLTAYLDFFTGAEDGYKVARRIVQRYDNYPISHWKMMFLAIEDQLNDFDGEFDAIQGEFDSESFASQSDASMRERKQQNLKASKNTEPNISSSSIDEKGALTIETVNIKNVLVKYYMIDAEILFSRAPFLKNNSEEFSYVKPCLQLNLAMRPEDASEEELSQFITKTVNLPAQFNNKNLVIEINAEGKQEFKMFYSSELKVQINEAFGEMKVVLNDKGIGKVYVKVFMMDNSGKETFYRDGYTDIRGKFEYANSSGGKLKSVKKFSILIHSDEYGSQIKEIAPPKDEQISTSTGISNPDNFVSSSINYLAQAKMDRISNRCDWVQSKRSK